CLCLRVFECLTLLMLCGLAGPSSAGLWRRSGLVGPSSAGLWRRSGLVEPSSAGLWRRSGLAGPSSAGLWRRSGLVGPSSAGLWRRSGLAEPSSAGLWRRSGLVGPSSAGLWRRSGLVEPSSAGLWRRSGLVEPSSAGLRRRSRLVRLRVCASAGISVVLDLTPNYRGSSGPWFSNVSVTNVAERLKSALVFWMNEGVDGVQLAGVERVAGVVPSLWSDIRAIVQNGTEEHPGKRVLIGVTERSAAEDVSALLSASGVDLLVSRVLRHSNTDGAELAQSVQLLYSSHSQTRLAWSLGGGAEGHLASLVGPALVRLQMLLLLTLPGTPVFNYGDEIGLMDQDTKFPRMLWDSDEELNGTLQVNNTNTLSSTV
ncbi:4F2 cell-surface antigen heavy chain-like, partial [Etheostoma cragini]|uniref:4F2 cell-surface antigen heavy chain-like n=1 Tax=Etheostoma cragini TaxID=417921 RepID=UPI00155E5E68